MACYADEGALPGDVIQLVVDGVVLVQSVWIGNGERERLILGTWVNTDIYLPVIQRGVDTLSPKINVDGDAVDTSPDFRMWLPWINNRLYRQWCTIAA